VYILCQAPSAATSGAGFVSVIAVVMELLPNECWVVRRFGPSDTKVRLELLLCCCIAVCTSISVAFDANAEIGFAADPRAGATAAIISDS